MKVLVTGGAGFIGSFLVDELIKKGHNVTIFDNLDPQVHQNKIPEYLNKQAKFIKGDVRNYDEFKEAIIDSEVIFHYAAKVGVGQSMYEIKDYSDVNQSGTTNMLHALANEEHDVKKVIVASSMSIYGEGSYKCEKCGKEYHNLKRKVSQLKKKEWDVKCGCGQTLTPIATNEEKRLDCTSVYAIGKKNQEEMVLTVGENYGIPSVALRLSNTYGPRQSLSNPYTGLGAMFMSSIKNNNPPTIFEDGQQKRNFTSVKDIVQGSVLAMEKKTANYEVFNVGSEEIKTVKEIAETLINVYGADLEPKITEEYRKGDIRHFYPDISKIKTKIDYEPTINFNQGMEELVKWSEKQEAKDSTDKALSDLKKRKLI